MGFLAIPTHTAVAAQNRVAAAAAAGAPMGGAGLGALQARIDHPTAPHQQYDLGGVHAHAQERRRVVLCDEEKPPIWTDQTDPERIKDCFV